jgi:mono/diheme cytochrome c family protein
MRFLSAKDAMPVGWFVTFSTMILLCLLSAATSGRAQESKSSAKPAANAGNAALVARGKYIVDDLAVCGTCHTPHDNKGQPDPAHPLEGAALWLNPTMQVVDWPLRAPRIGGTPPATNEEMVILLTTGIWTDGKRLRPPMPQFRMSREDAEAVVAYLRSVGMPPR